MSTVDIIDLLPGDVFDFAGGSWHGPSTLLSNDRSGPDPTSFDPQGGVRRLSFSNPRIVNPPGLNYLRDHEKVEVIA